MEDNQILGLILDHLRSMYTRLTENCAEIVNVLSIKSSETIKSSTKQPWNNEVSYQKVMYGVSHVFLLQIDVQRGEMHPFSQNRRTEP